MEKFFLDFLHFAYELDVIDNQKVVFTVLFFERVCFVALKCVNKVSSELFQSHIMDFFIGVFLFDGVAYRLDKVGLAQASASINKERIILGSRGVYYRLRGSIRQFVESADNERVEVVTGV